ncbi:VWA domain-containing protein [Corallococcus sp. H22C18031201]|uniref:vWA domain-containing protein n=1 Tax=Citreicoccus inhibens TaxID=2849499 RepID=UPI000E73F87C|nr:vWA domain-containing protein [Citreicoccus inhibens]MBU8894273.1 VWA domain-containing protein [Citreicoccus inhibens]RJS23037.1 VWA domain-containing protein [Corallococcus sp. H22C18031201]
MTTTQNPTSLPEAHHGPAERLLELVLGGSAHLWHNRPGLNVSGTWYAAAHATPQQRARGRPVAPGLFAPAAVNLYRQLLDIYRLNAELMAHFASYALTQTDWRDLKVATCALMLVQEHAGQPVRGDQGEIAFHDDDWRAIGEAMVLHYERKSLRMLTPKSVLRVAELLEHPEIAQLNRAAGFGDPASRKAPLGRWKRVATRWLAARESNLPMLQGLVKAGYKETLKKLARKAGYKPSSPTFFEVLGWKQKQSAGGHRAVGLEGLRLVKRERFDGLSEAEICEWISLERLSYKDVVGRLPKDVGLTPAILAAVLPSLSDRDLRMLTPTLEELGLLEDSAVKARWEKAVASATDQRALNIAKNVRGQALRQKLEEASDNAARQAVAEATAETDVRVMFLVDKSGSMEGAIEQSKEALARILAGFPLDKLHVAAFDTMGTLLKPKASNRAAVQHMLGGVKASGGTVHGAAVHALHRDGVRVPTDARLVVIVVGDEAGEAGDQFARAFRDCGYTVSALALMVSVVGARGNTVRTCAAQLRVPFSEVQVEQFADPYQVPRVLKALLDAPAATGVSQSGWVERVMRTPLLKVA